MCGRSIHEHVLRPLILCGRILLPTVDELRDGSDKFWRSVPVMRQPVLNAANMLKTADMLTIEDVSECALPRTTDVDTHASQQEKVMQIGHEAMSSILSSFISNLNPQKRTAILLVDLSVYTCDMARAFVGTMKSNALLYYVGFCEHGLEWATQHVKDDISEQMLDGSFNLPGWAVPSAEPPPELLAADPERPRLLTLVWSDVRVHNQPTLRVPDGIMRKWHDHAEFGIEFQAFREKAQAEKIIDVEAGDEPSTPNRGIKRDPSGTPKHEEIAAHTSAAKETLLEASVDFWGASFGEQAVCKLCW